jgi:hypothetical protein
MLVPYLFEATNFSIIRLLFFRPNKKSFPPESVKNISILFLVSISLNFFLQSLSFKLSKAFVEMIILDVAVFQRPQG